MASQYALRRERLCAGTCGQLIENRCTYCRACYFAASIKVERNKAICLEYTTGLLDRDQLARKYGISAAQVAKILVQNKARLPEELLKQRMAARKLVINRKGGRPPIWPDCPPHLKGQYTQLRKHYGYRAAEARDMLLEEERRSALKAA